MNETERTEPGSRIELYVQSLSPYGARAQQDEAIERLFRLAEAGTIAEFDLRVWGKHLCPNAAAVRTDVGEECLERLELFREWVGEDGSRADPFLDGHEVDDDIVGDSFTDVSTPVLLLAEFDGEELVHVTPCRRGDSVTTVHDRIATLERGAAALDSLGPDESTETGPSRAPGAGR
jgi:hypothetical protein